jgi:hypothetical protein
VWHITATTVICMALVLQMDFGLWPKILLLMTRFCRRARLLARSETGQEAALLSTAQSPRERRWRSHHAREDHAAPLRIANKWASRR